MQEIVTRYLDAWNETDPAARRGGREAILS